MDRTFLQNDADCIFDAMRAGDKSVAALAAVRRSDVNRFARAITGCARAERKDLILSAALMPEGAYDDTTFADLHYGQCYLDAAQLYDFALPMAYSQVYQKDGEWVRAVTLGTMKYNIPTITGLHAYEGGTAATLREDAGALSGLASDGICLFRDGAFVMAFTEGNTLHILNTLNKPITGLAIGKNGAAFSPDNPIIPGEEVSFRLTETPDLVRAFAGDEEISVWLTKN